MITNVSQYPEQVIPEEKVTLSTPSCFVEYGFYFYIFYSIMGAALGLFVSNIGSGILATLLWWCLLELRSRVITVIGLITFPLACGLSYLFIQVVLHDDSIMGENVRPFIIWVVGLVIVQSLALRRNFLHRFSFMSFLIGLALLPYFNFFPQGSAGYTRVGLDPSVGYSNPNQLGEWYGFCAVYFTILGYITKRNAGRVLCWLIALGCLYLLTLTVSRGALLAFVIAIIVASRHLLKRGFVPILLLACLGWIVIELGVFDQAMHFYSARGAEETGRFLIWPVIVESVLDSPLIGVGASHSGAVLHSVKFVAPHNGFLFLAQASGIIPCALFVAYWLRSAKAALNANDKNSPDSLFYIPLLIYTFLTVSLSNSSFMTPWALVSLAMPMAAGVRQQRLETLPHQRRGAEWISGFGIAK